MTNDNAENGIKLIEADDEAIRINYDCDTTKSGDEEARRNEYSKGVVDLTVGSPVKVILKFMLPLFIGNAVQLLYSWVDAIIVGIRDVNQFGSISASLPVVNLLITIMMGFMAGAMVVLGQFFGKKDYVNVRKCFVTTVYVLSGITIVISVLGYVFARPLLKLINISDELIDGSVIYLQIFCAGLASMIFYNYLAQALRSLGNSKIPLYALIFSAILNVGLDILFVFYFNMGVAGVAIPNVIAQVISVVFLVFYTQLKMPLLKFIGKRNTAKPPLRQRLFGYFDGKILKKIMMLATPSTLQQASATFGFIIINALINAKGSEYTTAFGTGNRIDELLSAVMMSFGIAMTNYVAQNKGKGDIERIKKGFKGAFIVSCLTVIAIASMILIFRDLFIKLFTLSVDNNADIDIVRGISTTYMGIVLPFYVFMSVMVFSTSSLRGAGDAKAAMSVNLLSLCIRITCAIIFTTATIRIFSINIDLFGFIERTMPGFYPFFKDYGVFFASPIGWISGAAFGIIRFQRGRWKKINIVSME